MIRKEAYLNDNCLTEVPPPKKKQTTKAVASDYTSHQTQLRRIIETSEIMREDDNVGVETLVLLSLFFLPVVCSFGQSPTRMAARCMVIIQLCLLLFAYLSVWNVVYLFLP